MKVLIIGANRGIGLALCKKFKDEGHEVVATCRKSSDDLKQLGIQVIESVDVTNIDSLERIRPEVGNIDILIHNSGIMIGDSFDSLNFDDLKKQFDVNTLGPLRTAKALGPLINKNGKLGIVSSRMGSIADNTSGAQYGYRASKTAVNSIGKSLSEDFKKHEVSVFLLHPGWVKTDMTRQNGLIDTTESANGLYKIMMEKDASQSGSFWHTNGEELPW